MTAKKIDETITININLYISIHCGVPQYYIAKIENNVIFFT
jgi:hypothetical protein